MDCSKRDVQSSQVRCAFWQLAHARLAFFFFGPSRVRVGCDEDSALSLAPSRVRFRLMGNFFLGSVFAGSVSESVEEVEVVG